MLLGCWSGEPILGQQSLSMGMKPAQSTDLYSPWGLESPQGNMWSQMEKAQLEIPSE